MAPGLRLASCIARAAMKSGKFNKLSTLTQFNPIRLSPVASFSTKVHNQSLLGRNNDHLGQWRRYSTQAETNLVGFLKEEIEAETELARKNLSGREAPTIPGFEIKTDEAEVRLLKNYGSEKITVTFNVNHSVDPDIHTEMEHQDKQQEPTATVMISRPSFTVEIEKGQQKLAFECEMYDDEGEVDQDADLFQIDEVYVYSGEVADKVYSTTGSVIDGQLYEHLMGYLEERGIENKFASDLCKFATHYEHAQYVALLRKIQDFMAK